MYKRSKKMCLATSVGFSVTMSIGTLLHAMPAYAASDSIVQITQSGPDAHRRLSLGLKKAIVVDLPEDAHDILVSDPDMADAITRTSRRLYIFGKSVGQTNIFVFGSSGQPVVTIDIQIERDIAGLRENLKRFIPDSDISVEIVSDNVVLTGTVPTAQSATQAIDLVGAFLKGGEATTRVTTASGGAANSDVAVNAEDRQQSQIINLLQIAGEDQVTVKVTIAEVRRSVLKQLGFSTKLSGPGPFTSIGTSPSTAPTGGGELTASVGQSLGPFSISSELRALENSNMIRTLAEPTLTAISGQSASFHVGGTRLFQTENKDGEITITPFEYGVNLNFKPIVLSSGRINLRISTSVTEPTQGPVAGAEFNDRRTETSVELPSGGSLALSGIVSDNFSNKTSGTPGLSRVPIFGTLFRQKAIERNETELVIIATPYLVRPVNRNQLARPDDNLALANDSKSFFLNRVNKIYGHRQIPLSEKQFHGNVGFIYK